MCAVTGENEERRTDALRTALDALIVDVNRRPGGEARAGGKRKEVRASTMWGAASR